RRGGRGGGAGALPRVRPGIVHHGGLLQRRWRLPGPVGRASPPRRRPGRAAAGAPPRGAGIADRPDPAHPDPEELHPGPTASDVALPVGVRSLAGIGPGGSAASLPRTTASRIRSEEHTSEL